ncbi:putative secreted protein (Por secretion system target) [Spirosoma oryzae]|uniref:Putative secreted protein (Por secretion system target) n=1 Tax=Spirosoma oryzae TaxID=1469603 RepID=A0A2T0SR80_9BACT|nr:zinc-dependent metalloprotease [Spirosoma oryzae]PRY35910.1 putative secreted protein (Por secretion system target) [Spirosoma oryzae]
MRFHFLPVFFVLVFLVSISGLAQPKFVCGTSDHNLPDSVLRLMSLPPETLMKARAGVGSQYVCRLALEIDSDTYLTYEKDTNRLKEALLKQIASVSAVYEREINTRLVVVLININKDPAKDPYAGENNIYILSNRFNDVWSKSVNAVPYDKRLYVYTKSLTGGAVGLGGGKQAIAYLGKFIIAHELGHTFDSPHTHSCNWAGGPLDFCVNSEGDCYKESLDQTAGTIMGYCGTLDTFHPRCQAIMLNHADKNLPKRTRPDSPPILPATITLAGSPFLMWAAAPMADNYTVELATDPSFGEIALRDTVDINGVRLDRLVTERSYYLRIRALSLLGNSDWSATSRLQFDPLNPVGPRLISPAQDTRFFDDAQPPIRLSLEPVAGATGYEVELTTPTDVNFTSPFSRQMVSTPFLDVTGVQGNNLIFWRVRASTRRGKTAWSTTGRFLVRQALALNLPGPVNGVLPTRFPINCSAQTAGSTIRLTLSKQASFGSVVWTREYKGNYYQYVSMLDSLSPASTYYLKLEEILNGPHPASSSTTGMINQVVQSFRTAAASLSDRWSFINGHTVKGYPTGGYTNGAMFSDKGAWVRHSASLLRIDADSLLAYQYERALTGGQLGNVISGVSTDRDGNVLVTNSISTGGNAANPTDQLVVLDGRYGRILTRFPIISDRSVRYQNPNRQIIISNRIIYELKNGKVTALMNVPTNASVEEVVLQSNYCWIRTTNYTSSRNELIRIALDTRVVSVFSQENTPLLTQYLNELAVDQTGQLWIRQSSTNYPLIQFDGANWTGLTAASLPFYTASSLTTDRAGVVHVLSNNNVIYRYASATWQKVVDLNPSFNMVTVLGRMQIDNQGKFWFTSRFGLMCYDPCLAMTTPRISTSLPVVNYGESIVLQADGCVSANWSWTDSQGNSAERLVAGTNQLTAVPQYNTTYRVRCQNEGCASKASSPVEVAVRPVLMLKGLQKRTFCPREAVLATYSLRGAATDAFRLTIKNDEQRLTLMPDNRDSTLTAYLPESVTAGVYWVSLESVQPVIKAIDSVRITVHALPVARLSSDKAAVVPGDSIQISVALTGAAPWQFNRWDRQMTRTSETPYVTTIKAIRDSTYRLTVSGLSDANCTGGIVSNVLTISSLILATESPAPDGLSVYPNPATGQLTIEGDAVTGIRLLRLIDGQGREVNRQQPASQSKREIWDVSTLPTGLYILQISLSNGQQSLWKINKQ